MSILGDLPLHPAIVHVPLALAGVVPPLALVVAWAIARGSLPRKAWLGIVGLQAVLVLTGLIAMNTGEDDEDIAKNFASRDEIHEHEERADVFFWTSFGVLVVAGVAVAAKKDRAFKALTATTVLAGFVGAGLGAWVGHAGGTMVHQNLRRLAGAPSHASDSHDGSDDH